MAKKSNEKLPKKDPEPNKSSVLAPKTSKSSATATSDVSKSAPKKPKRGRKGKSATKELTRLFYPKELSECPGNILNTDELLKDEDLDKSNSTNGTGKQSKNDLEKNDANGQDYYFMNLLKYTVEPEIIKFKREMGDLHRGPPWPPYSCTEIC